MNTLNGRLRSMKRKSAARELFLNFKLTRPMKDINCSPKVCKFGPQKTYNRYSEVCFKTKKISVDIDLKFDTYT